MEAAIATGQEREPSEDVMSRVAIAPSAISRWRHALDQFAEAATCLEHKDPSTYPCETAHDVGDGSLDLRIAFASGDEVSMRIAPSEWRWSKCAPIH